MSRNARSAASTLAQLAHFVDASTGAVVPPLHTATTYARNDSYELIGNYIYGRYQNPTCDPVEAIIAELEGAAEAKLFASGMAAATAVFETLRAGQHVAAPRIMYHGLQDWLRRIAETRDIGLTLYDATDLDALRTVVEPGRTAIVWIETLLNPTWDVIDVAGSARIAHQAGAILAVDATVTPPLALRTLEHGADIVFHSATKYLNGHSDVTAGVLATKVLDARWQEIKTIGKLVGATPGPFEAWLLLRGMRTLAVRYQRQCENALRIAWHFERHRAIERVLYPGLPTHPGHALAKAQLGEQFGGMLSLCVRGGAEAARRVAASVKLLIPATSLGGVESLIEHRASVEGPHSAVAKNLLRVSVGIEDAQDLIDDLEQALANVF